MSQIKLHISCLSPISEDALALLPKDKFLLSWQNKLASGEKELAETISSVDAVYVGGDDYYSANVLHQAKNLKLISFGGIGYDSFIDTKTATELGIAITNTPGANSQSVAEFAIGLALDALRKITYSSDGSKPAPSRELGALQIGLIGYGKINQTLMKILHNGFGADVKYWNRTPTSDSAYADLDTILSSSDIIFIAITANKDTADFINTDQFSKMKDEVILINPARPALVNEPALNKALQSGKVSAYAMDGYFQDNKFKEFNSNKLICTPHIAARTTDAWNKTDIIAFQNIIDYFAAGTSSNIVNPTYKEAKMRGS